MAASRISACMVLYHQHEEALKAVDCIAASTEAVDTFIVDNSPGDDTADRIRWAHPGVTVLPQEKNIGFGRANNLVLPKLQSDYHLIVNPDVTFAPDLLTEMVAYMDRNPNVVILTPRVLNPDGTEQFLPKKQPTVRYLLSGLTEQWGGIFRKWRRDFTMADQIVTQPVRVGFATGCFLLIRTEAFRRLKGFDERFFLYQEDSDLSRRAQELGPIIYHPDMIVTHLWKRDNVHSAKGRRQQIRSIIKFFHKWGVAW